MAKPRLEARDGARNGALAPHHHRDAGGAAGPDDFVKAVVEGGADAVLAASIFHRRIHAIADVKAAMAAAGLPVRLVPQVVS